MTTVEVKCEQTEPDLEYITSISSIYYTANSFLEGLQLHHLTFGSWPFDLILENKNFHHD